MGTEMDKYYYNRVYGGAYHAKNPYVYSRIINMIEEDFYVGCGDKKILDLGCGISELGLMLARKYQGYKGIDFSDVAIDFCNENNPNGSNIQFEKRNIYDPDIYWENWDIILAVEVLEHVQDLAIISHIQLGTKFIFSVPTWTGIAHLRAYNGKMIRERYGELLQINNIESYFKLTKDPREILLVESIRK